MRTYLFLIMISAATVAVAQNDTIMKSVGLPNGWTLTPYGHSLPLGDLPLNIILSPSGKWMAVTNNGQSTQTIQLIDPIKKIQTCSVEIPKSWYGLAFSNDDKYLYASGGNDNWILQYHISQGKLFLNDSIPLGEKWPEKISPAGIAIDDGRQKLYVVTKENNSLYFVDLKTKTVRSIHLGAEAYTCLLSPDKKRIVYLFVGWEKNTDMQYHNREINRQHFHRQSS